MTLRAGRDNLRESFDAIDQLLDAKISAAAPSVSIGAPLSRRHGAISMATPAIPITSAVPKRSVSRWVLRKTTSDSAINAGIVANMTAATPEGTRCSAQNNDP